MPTVTSANPCPCCCPPDGKKCFQEWIADWSCDTLEWTGPVTDNRLCLPMNTSTDWVKTSDNASGCQYRKYVPYDPKHCCTANGDCSGLGDTATPALPFGGGAPPDCCATAAPCSFCTGATPRTMTVTFDGVGNSVYKCASECAFGGIQGGTGTLGTYTLTQDPLHPCCWIYHGSGPSVLIYHDDPTCSGSPVEYGTIKIKLCLNFTTWSLRVTIDQPYVLDGGGDSAMIIFDDDGTTTGDANCCTEKDFTSSTTYSCGTPGEGGTAVVTPHC